MFQFGSPRLVWLNTLNASARSENRVRSVMEKFLAIERSWFTNLDLSIAKNFSITERTRFTLRAEAFNVFNHTNLGDPNWNITDGNAGQITGLAPGYQMRRLQFGFRVDF